MQEFEYPANVQTQRNEPQQPVQAEAPVAPNTNTGRPAPKISPELQAHINQRLAAATALEPYTEEVVTPEGATLPVREPVYTPRRDEDSTSANLPSRFVFYDFTDLFIGKFKTRHFAKLHEAHVTKSMAYMLEAVSSIIHTSNPAYEHVPLAFELTIPDYYWILYYIRLNQIKSQLTHTTTCKNPEHIALVHEGKASIESLDIVTNVTNSQIHTKMLGAIPDQSLPEYQFELFTLRPPLMKDVVESLENPLFLVGTDEGADYRYLARVASLIKLKDNPDATLEERIKIIEDLDFDTLAQIGKYEAAISSYGPEEFINVTCKECGHQRKTKVTLDARSFLPI